MIDREVEELLTLPQAAAKLPGRKAGKPISPSTVWRWAVHGVGGIKLETMMLGATTYTSQEALDRFFAAVERKKRGEPAPEPAPGRRPTVRRLRKEEDEIEARLLEKLKPKSSRVPP